MSRLLCHHCDLRLCANEVTANGSPNVANLRSRNRNRSRARFWSAERRLLHIS
jgi:hypothetical protein